MKTAQYLDLAKKSLGVQSDYALCKQLDISTSRIANWRKGRNLPDTAIAVKLAQITGVDELKVVADIELERGSNDAFWSKIALRVASIAAGVAALMLANYLVPGFDGFNISQIASADANAWALVPLLAYSGPEIHIVAFTLALALLWTTLRPWLVSKHPRTP